MKKLANVFAAVALLALGSWGIYFVTARLYQVCETHKGFSPRAADRAAPHGQTFSLQISQSGGKNIPEQRVRARDIGDPPLGSFDNRG